MGLLDDAIREHLELKRRHGADPSEVARQESEALGPARRTAQAEAPIAFEDEPEPDFGSAPAFEDELEPIFEPAPVDEAQPEPAFEPEPEPEPVARDVEEYLDQPTVEHPAAKPDPEPEPDPEPPREASEGNDDVLEGTPEFLEETPEHDRLWFEQRPPRDFDFDD
jgi:hypothetical protein